jgi:hypothetical protein
MPVAIVAATVLSVPSAAGAATTVGSPLTALPISGVLCGTSTFTNVALGAGILHVPFAGALVRWRLDIPEPGGTFTYRLRVLRPAGVSSYTGAGTGPPQSALHSGVNVLPLASPLPVQAGDLIGIDCPGGAPSPFASPALPESTYAFFGSGLADGSTASPTNEIANDEELINADVVGTPSVSGVSPSSGPATGGTAVVVSGAHLGETTAVTFGGVPATAVLPISENEVNATAPAHAAGVVDVQVVNAAGTSAAAPVDSFSYQAGAPVSLPPLAKPSLTSVTQSSAVWREGRGLPQISRRKRRPIGTTFSFALNEQAAVSFRFTRLAPGRIAGHKCVAKNQRNAKGKSCQRTVTEGSLSLTGHAGTNRLVFQGRISSSERLKPGRYLLTTAATNTAGTSTAAALSFQIVK